MKRDTFYIIAAIVLGLFGLGFLLIPDVVMSFYGTSLDILSRFLCRYFSTALIGVALILYLGRNARNLPEAVRAVLIGGFVMCILGLIISIWDGFAGMHTTLFRWVNALVYGLMAIGFGYYYLVKKAAA